MNLSDLEIGDLKQNIENRTGSMLLTMQSNHIKSIRRVTDQAEICELIAKPNFHAVEQHGCDQVLIIETEGSLDE